MVNLKLNATTRTDQQATSFVMTLAPQISDDFCRILQWVLFSVACQTIDVLGSIANFINIICFVKQGFKDIINISFLGLAISDLGCLLTLIFTNICFTPIFQESDLPFEPVGVQYLVSSWPHVIFTRITSWITALITVERCLCITMPLKVKTIVTPQRMTAIVVSLFVLLVCSASPVYVANQLAWRFSPQRNRTILSLVFTANRESIEQISFTVNNICIPTIAFVIITVCTAVLVINLRIKTHRRQKLTAVGHQGLALTKRDQRVTKMVVIISTVFIVCFLPDCAIFVAILLNPEFAIGRKDINTTLVLSGIGLLLKSANSATNIFIYYHASSRYREVFRQLFMFCEKNKQQLGLTTATDEFAYRTSTKQK